MKLSQQLEEVESDCRVERTSIGTSCITFTADPAHVSYEKLKAVAICLAKACEEASYWARSDDVNGFARECCVDALTRAAEILKGEV